MKTKIILLAILFALFAAVTGCSSGPSEGDIRAALERESEETAAFIGGKNKDRMKTQIHSVKIIGCKEAKDSTGFYCDYELDMTAPMFGRHKGPTRDLFLKTDSGWVRMAD